MRGIRGTLGLSLRSLSAIHSDHTPSTSLRCISTNTRTMSRPATTPHQVSSSSASYLLPPLTPASHTTSFRPRQLAAHSIRSLSTETYADSSPLTSQQSRGEGNGNGTATGTSRPGGTSHSPDRERHSTLHKHPSDPSGARYAYLTPGGGTGDEPGVDVQSRRDQEAYEHLTASTNVTVGSFPLQSTLTPGHRLLVRSRGP